MTPEFSQEPPNLGVPRPALAPAAQTTDATLSEALIVLRKRRLVLAIAVLLGGMYGIYRGLTQPKLYEASGRIEIHSGASSEYKLSSGAMPVEDASTRMQTQVTIIQSDTLLLSVAREMNLANNPQFLGRKTPGPTLNIDDPATRQMVIRTLGGGLKVAVVPKTDIIKITYSSLNGKLSADIVNKVIADYIQRNFATRFESTQKISQWLSGQLDDLKEKVETSQQRMMDLQRKLGVVGIDQTHNELASQIDDLEKASSQAELARIVSEARYRSLAGMDPNSMESSIDSTSAGANGGALAGLTSLRNQLATAQADYAQMVGGVIGPKNPQALALRAKIAELTKAVDTEQSRLLLQAKQNFQLSQANEVQTQAALDAAKANAYKLRDDLVEYTLQSREFESDRTLYEGLLQRLRTAGVEAGLESTEIDIVDNAVIPASPKLESKTTMVLTSTFVALVLGVLLAFLLESLDTGLRSIAEIEAITELPSLAIVPRARRPTPEQLAGMSTVERNINVLTQPKSQFTEAFRSLRTALLLATTNGREPKYILFTSATPSEGKTTASSNLATVLAQSGAPVILVDADLRRPNIHHRFGLVGKLGLSTVLSGSSTLEGSIQRVKEIPNLDILASGPVPPFPTEMLSSEKMSELLLELGRQYTYVVIDSPPILSVTDGVILARQTDAAILVVRHGKSSKHVVRRARDLLLRSGAPLRGIVLNAVDMNSPEYYGYYGYSGYGYGGYGYSYSSADSGGWESKTGNGGNGDGKKGK